MTVATDNPTSGEQAQNTRRMIDWAENDLSRRAVLTLSIEKANADDNELDPHTICKVDYSMVGTGSLLVRALLDMLSDKQNSDRTYLLCDVVDLFRHAQEIRKEKERQEAQG